MPKLVLYSAQETPADHEVNLRLMEMLPPQPRIGWVPSDFISNSDWFQQKVGYYAQYGATLQEPVQFDRPFDAADLQNLFSCDAIHLSGGDSVQFLSLLRQHHLLQAFRDYVQQGGVLVGISAGAILMTPTIETTFEGEYGDERPTEPFDFSALGLVDFAFLPHYVDDLHTRCQELTREVGRTLYACRDGAAVLVQGENIEPIGEVLAFHP